MNLLWCKVDVKRFGFSKHHQDFDIRIVHIAMDAYRDFDPYLLSYQVYMIWKHILLKTFLNEPEIFCFVPI